jgi:subtilisin family serine protease
MLKLWGQSGGAWAVWAVRWGVQRGLSSAQRWVCGLLPVAVFVTGGAWAQPSGVRSAADHQRHNTVLQAAAAKGSVPVIVELVPQQAGDVTARSQQSQAVQLSELRAKQNRVLSRLVTARSNAGVRTPQAMARLKQFNYFPLLSLRASAQDVQALLNDPEVKRVYQDVPRKPTLLDSTARIGMVSGAFQGRTGAGQVVAVLDSGIDKTHPYLAGKVVSEACFSTTDTTNPNDLSTSLCPGGVSSSTAVDSGVPCTQLAEECRHGTMVAGVVAANTHPSYGSGVAPSAQLISIQIYSLRDNPLYDPQICDGLPQCIVSWLTDEVLGLERVYAMRSTYRIAAVNLSLGGGQYSTNCDWELEYPIVALLRAVDIATVVSSGNGGGASFLSAPACLSNVISVGSTTDFDTVSGFSNSAAMLQLLAPGEDIWITNSSGSSFDDGDGTSFSAPMVSGALAVLREQQPQASVDTLLGLLKNTGLSVVDSRNLLMKPRIRVDQAMSGLDSLTRVPNGKPLVNQWGAVDQFSYYTVVVPTGATNLSIRTQGGTGNPTMYVRRASRPTTSTFDCSSSNAGTSETCSFPSPTAGTYYVMLSAASAYSDVSVLADFDLDCASSSNVVLPTAISGSAEYTTCGTIWSNASGTEVPTTGVLQLNAPGGIRLRTGFRLTSGARLWVRVYPELQ